MPDFIYVALNKQGQQVSGEVEARDRERAIRKVHSHNLTLTRLDPVKPMHWIWHILEPITPGILVLFIRELATMLAAGVPMMRTLQVLTSHPGPRRFCRAVRRLVTDVGAGYSLSQAMLRAPEYFSAFLIGSVRVGEVSGRLSHTLDHCAGYVEKEYEYGLRLKNAFIYPTVLLGACGILMAFIFNVMIPNFVALFLDLSMKLPWTTQLLVDTARLWDMFGPNVVATLAGPTIVAGWLFYRWAITPMGRIGLESLLLRVPWYGKQVKNRMLARFFRSFATLILAGVKVSSCLELLVRTLDRELLIRSARSQLHSIHEGLTISQGMSLSGIFPPMAIELVYVGEETGRLDAVLNRLSNYFDEEMTRGLDSISKLVEPVVLFILGGFVGFILLAAFMPIYQLAGSF